MYIDFNGYIGVPNSDETVCVRFERELQNFITTFTKSLSYEKNDSQAASLSVKCEEE